MHRLSSVSSTISHYATTSSSTFKSLRCRNCHISRTPSMHVYKFDKSVTPQRHRTSSKNIITWVHIQKRRVPIVSRNAVLVDRNLKFRACEVFLEGSIPSGSRTEQSNTYPIDRRDWKIHIPDLVSITSRTTPRLHLDPTNVVSVRDVDARYVS